MFPPYKLLGMSWWPLSANLAPLWSELLTSIAGSEAPSVSGSSEGRTEQGHFLSQKVFPVPLNAIHLPVISCDSSYVQWGLEQCFLPVTKEIILLVQIYLFYYQKLIYRCFMKER